MPSLGQNGADLIGMSRVFPKSLTLLRLVSTSYPKAVGLTDLQVSNPAVIVMEGHDNGQADYRTSGEGTKRLNQEPIPLDSIRQATNDIPSISLQGQSERRCVKLRDIGNGTRVTPATIYHTGAQYIYDSSALLCQSPLAKITQCWTY